MINPKALLPGVVALLAVTPGSAEEHGGFGRALELPAHRALIELRERPGTTPSRFESDGCSGGMSGAWRLVVDQFPGFARDYEAAPPWESCCVTHDRAYYDGAGAPDAGASFDARLQADRTLETCVIEMGTNRKEELAGVYGIRPDQVETAFATIGGAMFWAVRLGGGPCTGLPWRWGFGFPDCSVLAAKED
jgi:hypothetical protein